MMLPNIPWKAIGTTLGKHAPSILTGVGIGGYITATVMAAIATRGYQDERTVETHTMGTDEYGERIISANDHKLGATEEARLFLKHYWPTMLVIGGSTACVLLANKMNLQRQAALAAACSISETALKNYKAKAIEVLGPKEEQKQIEHAIHEDYLQEHKEEIVSDRGLYPIEMQIILDDYSGTKFYLTEEDVRQAVNEFNADLICEGMLVYDDLWSKLYERSANRDKIVKPKSVNAVGFKFDSKKDLLEAHFDHGTVDNIPISILTFRPEPESTPGIYW